MEHCPCGLVGAKSKKTVERLGRHPVLWRGHVPSRSKPYCKGRFRTMENCARRGRYPATARFAPPAAIFHAPPRDARTCWARKPGRPTHPVKVIKTGSIIRKPAEKVSIVSWVINTSFGTNLRFRCFHPDILALPHLYGYPVNIMRLLRRKVNEYDCGDVRFGLYILAYGKYGSMLLVCKAMSRYLNGIISIARVTGSHTARI